MTHVCHLCIINYSSDRILRQHWHMRFFPRFWRTHICSSFLHQVRKTYLSTVRGMICPNHVSSQCHSRKSFVCWLSKKHTSAKFLQTSAQKHEVPRSSTNPTNRAYLPKSAQLRGTTSTNQLQPVTKPHTTAYNRLRTLHENPQTTNAQKVLDKYVGKHSWCRRGAEVCCWWNPSLFGGC